MISEPGDLIVREVLVNSECNGPLQYRVRWVCWQCGREDVLGKRASLLPDETVMCEQCGNSNRYRFNATVLESQPGSLSKISALEESYFEKIHSGVPACISLLGHNFMFPVFAYFSNRLRLEHD